MRLTTTPTRLERDPGTSRPRGLRAVARQVAGEITPDVIEQIAHRVADLLTQRDQRPTDSGAMLTVNQLAIRLNVTRAWIYEHAAELGGIRLGNGPKARLRFDPDTAIQALRRHQASGAPSIVHTRERQAPAPRVEYARDAPLIELRRREMRAVRALLPRVRGRIGSV